MAERVEKILIENEYDGESLSDIFRDVSEAIDEDFSYVINEIPQDDDGFMKGKFTLKILWSEDE